MKGIDGFLEFNSVLVECHWQADPSSRAVQSVGLRLFTCWDWGFESCRGHRWLFLVNVECC